MTVMVAGGVLLLLLLVGGFASQRIMLVLFLPYSGCYSCAVLGLFLGYSWVILGLFLRYSYVSLALFVLYSCVILLLSWLYSAAVLALFLWLFPRHHPPLCLSVGNQPTPHLQPLGHDGPTSAVLSARNTQLRCYGINVSCRRRLGLSFLSSGSLAHQSKSHTLLS